MPPQEISKHQWQKFNAQYENFEQQLITQLNDSTQISKILARTFSCHFLRGHQVIAKAGDLTYAYSRKTGGEKNIKCPALSITVKEEIMTPDGEKLFFNTHENANARSLVFHYNTFDKNYKASTLAIYIYLHDGDKELPARFYWLTQNIIKVQITLKVLSTFCKNTELIKQQSREKLQSKHQLHAQIENLLKRPIHDTPFKNMGKLEEIFVQTIEQETTELSIRSDLMSFVNRLKLYHIDGIHQSILLEHTLTNSISNFVDKTNHIVASTNSIDASTYQRITWQLLFYDWITTRCDKSDTIETWLSKNAERFNPRSSWLENTKIDHICFEPLLITLTDGCYYEAVYFESKQWWETLSKCSPYFHQYIQAKNNKLLDNDKLTHKSSPNSICLDRHILRLIFCLQCIEQLDHTGNLIQQDPKGSSNYDRKMACRTFRQSVSYIMRETIRFNCHGRTPFYSSPVKFAEHLLNVIKFHAEHVINIRLPSDMFSQMIQTMGTDHRTDQRLALEHIQHITDIYIAGFVLGETNIALPKKSKEPTEKDSTDENTRRNIDGCRIFEFLSSPVKAFTETDVRYLHESNIRKSFALAALFHDFAMLEHRVQKIKGKKVAPETIEKAKATLLQHSVFDELGQEKITAFLNEPNIHSLLSAAKLVETIEQQNQLYGQEESFSTMDFNHVIKPATLAILRHSMPQFPCDVGKYHRPTTLWLSMLDELMEWHPSTDLEPDYYRTVDLSPFFDLSTPAKNTQPVKEHIVLNSVELISVKKQLMLQVPIQEDEVPDFPQFFIKLSSFPSMSHRVIPSLLTLAQTFGRINTPSKVIFREGSENTTEECTILNWIPRAYVEMDQEVKEVVGQIERSAAHFGGVITPHLLGLCEALLDEKNNDRLELGKVSLPFANMDIRDYLRDLDFSLKPYNLVERLRST